MLDDGRSTFDTQSQHASNAKKRVNHPDPSSNRSGLFTGIPTGCAFAFVSAAITCGLLVFNAAVVMVLLKTFARSSSQQWARDPRLLQFLLLLGPVALVVMQWMLLDYLRRKLPRKRIES